MKKILITMFLSTLLITTSKAASIADLGLGVNAGISASAGLFEVDGGKETNADATKNTSTNGEEAKGLFGIGSIFGEISVLDNRFAIGFDYVPHSLESETTENIQYDSATMPTAGTKRTNTAQVDFDDFTTLYAIAKVNENFYIKAGMLEVDVITNENLGTGGAYGNTSLDGTLFGIGYDRSLENGVFIRAEANHMNIDGVTLTNTNDSTKSITVDGITGYGAKVSIGKSF